MFLERVGSAALPHGAVAFGERLKESFEDVMRQSYAASPRTVLHGDFRIDNLLFDDAAAPADRVGVLDWQISGRGPGVFDVAYLPSGSMTVEERRTAEVDIVRSWYDALGSPDGYSYDDAWSEYRRTSMVTTVYGVVSAAQMDPANERGRELVEAMAVRSFTACLDPLSRHHRASSLSGSNGKQPLRTENAGTSTARSEAQRLEGRGARTRIRA